LPKFSLKPVAAQLLLGSLLLQPRQRQQRLLKCLQLRLSLRLHPQQQSLCLLPLRRLPRLSPSPSMRLQWPKCQLQ
jgi:hypothetical protein